MKTAAKKTDHRFEFCFDLLMENEGGYVDDPDDSGGETKYGISKRSYPDIDIINLTIGQAREIYYSDFWIGSGINMIQNLQLASKVFDVAVNTGPVHSVRFLQEGANLLGAGLDADGLIGPITSGWVNDYRYPLALVSAFKVMAGNYYIEIDNKKFLAGWLIRLDK